MFGFLRGANDDGDYRRAYARCCRYLRLEFGWRSAPVVSYEAVFAYQLMRDALGAGPLPESEPKCCKLRGAAKLADAEDRSVAHVCNALALLLASIKLEDDIRDDKSLTARAAMFWLIKPIRRAHACFAEIDPQAPDKFRNIVRRHVEMESSHRGVSLAEFAKPTGEGFGYAFSLIARSDARTAKHADTFEAVGAHVGTAIIAGDCAFDYRRDLRRGLPNPVRSADEASRARTDAQRSLASAGWAWSDAIGGNSGAVRTLRNSIDRLGANTNATEPTSDSPRLLRLSKPRLRFARAGDCDCGGCDGCGGSDCNGCGGEIDSRDCDWSYVCFSGCDEPCDVTRKKQDATASKAVRGGGSFVGREGHANGDLTPEGTVVINGRTHPARTQGETIHGGAKVLVLEDGEFGLVVSASDSD